MSSTIGTVLGFGEESTYGMAVSRTNWLATLGAPLQQMHEWVDEEVLGWSGDVGNVVRARHKASTKVEGTFETELAYDDSTVLLFKHLLGVVGTSGAGPYTHAITLGNQPTGLTIEKIKGKLGTSELFVGCILTRCEWSVETGGVARATWTVLGKSSTRETAGTPTLFFDRNRVIHANAGVLAFNSVNYTCASLSGSIDRTVEATQDLGSYTTGAPVRIGPTRVQIVARMRGSFPALNTAWSAGTQADATVIFTSGSDTLTLKVSQAQVTQWSDSSETGIGQYYTDVTFDGTSDGSDLGFVATFVNPNSNATDNS